MGAILLVAIRGNSLVIIDYFNINGIALNPLETDTPLIIHSNAVLTFSIS